MQYLRQVSQCDSSSCLLKKCSQRQAINLILKMIRQFKISPPLSPRKRSKQKTALKHYNEDAVRKILAVLDSSCPLAAEEAEPARLYLENRGLRGLPYAELQGLRYVPKLAYSGEHGHLEYSPAIVAPLYTSATPQLLCRSENEGSIEGCESGSCREFDPDSDPVSVQRIYITEDGYKPTFTPHKKLMTSVYDGAAMGAAVQLGIPEDELHVAEGIETALAIYLATQESVWAAVSANGMAKLVVPSKIKKAVIWPTLIDLALGSRLPSH